MMPQLAPAQRRDYTYKVTIPPAGFPVTLAEAKAALRVKVSNTKDDDLINLYISAATDAAEALTRRWFIDRTAKTFRDFFPGYSSEGYYGYSGIPAGVGNGGLAAVGGNSGFEIRKSPLKTIVQIQYFKSGSLTTVDSALYYNTTEEDYSEVLTVSTAAWPSDGDVRLQAVEITFTAGFGADATVMPGWVKTAILMHVANLYANRGDCGNCGSGETAQKWLPAAAKGMYLQHRIENL